MTQKDIELKLRLKWLQNNIILNNINHFKICLQTYFLGMHAKDCAQLQKNITRYVIHGFLVPSFHNSRSF